MKNKKEMSAKQKYRMDMDKVIIKVLFLTIFSCILIGSIFSVIAIKIGG